MVAFLMVEHLADRTYDFEGGAPGMQRLLSAQRKPFRTRNGHLCVLPFTDRHWRDFATAAGRLEWAEDERLATVRARGENFELQYRLMAEALSERTSEEWLEALNQASIPAAPATSLEDVFKDPHLEAVGMFTQMDQPGVGRVTQIRQPVSYSATPTSVHRPAPLLGEHTHEVLREAGLTATEIDRLKASGACN